MYFRYITFLSAAILLTLARPNNGAEPDASVISYGVPSDTALTADPTSPFWRSVKGVLADHDNMGAPVTKNKMEVRSRWTSRNLYLLFVCDYDALTLKPDANPHEETNGLWNWDVAETFIGDDFQNINRYKEFEVSPQGEWVDLDIDRSQKEGGSAGWRWNSRFRVKSRIDREKKVWYAEMCIPFEAISHKPAEPGLQLRINLYRCAGRSLSAHSSHGAQRTHPLFTSPRPSGFWNSRPRRPPPPVDYRLRNAAILTSVKDAEPQNLSRHERCCRRRALTTRLHLNRSISSSSYATTWATEI